MRFLRGIKSELLKLIQGRRNRVIEMSAELDDSYTAINGTKESVYRVTFYVAVAPSRSRKR